MPRKVRQIVLQVVEDVIAGRADTESDTERRWSEGAFHRQEKCPMKWGSIMGFSWGFHKWGGCT